MSAFLLVLEGGIFLQISLMQDNVDWIPWESCASFMVDFSSECSHQCFLTLQADLEINSPIYG